MGVVITGIGVSSALGNHCQTWQRLLRGESAIHPIQPFSVLPPAPLAMIGPTPHRLTELLPPLIADVVADAQLELPLPDCGVVVGSSRGCQGDWEAAGGARSQSLSWQTHGLDAAAWHTAAMLHSRGPVQAPMAACATGLWAIAQGYRLIQRGECDRVIVGAVEAPITPLTLAGFAKMGALAQTGCYPFDRHREGLALGEGGALFCLESTAIAAARHAPIYAEIRGIGFTADAHHVSAPDPSGHGARQAIHHCLHRAQLTPHQISYLHAHGTSTHRNDLQEAAVIAQLFPPTLPISSTKGATGHTLGASGALGVAVCALAMRSQTLPPCVGLRDSAFPALHLIRQATPAPIDHTLCLSFGFGGQNAAVILSVPE
ncbi:beta-ketoacyl-ACP synthase [Spirulina major CS-329]|uniref:beta-ketoacyl-ACP synthase n=1 Tax=Spirulina TaxID=1154 RepID=UPI00232D2D35|nr:MULTISPECIES: beta-ketoacyl-ACP synthase [Spirulina]MDB9494997.1 beta-ketoacyl-ACP synthase [Spirulina subsalsa CS-330]MDB9502624.1 beta-ketoacyl-ACP synthase [Spirulina major CS-329]